MDWVSLSENVVLRLAAFAVAAGIVWRYIVVPGWRKIIVGGYRGVRNFFRRAKALTAEVEKIRALATDTHMLAARELNDDGNGSVKSTVRKSAQQIHVLGELFTAHLADSELQHHHMAEQLKAQGIDITPLEPRERWRWINGRTDDTPDQ